MATDIRLRQRTWNPSTHPMKLIHTPPKSPQIEHASLEIDRPSTELNLKRNSMDIYTTVRSKQSTDTNFKFTLLRFRHRYYTATENMDSCRIPH